MYGFCLTMLTEIAEGEKNGMRARVLSVKCECVELSVSSDDERCCHRWCVYNSKGLGLQHFWKDVASTFFTYLR